MRCVIIAENFKKSLSYVERATGKDLTLPILSSFCLSTEGGSLRVMGTNLEIGIYAFVRATVQDQGSVVIPARQLLSYISTLAKDEKVTIESSGVDVTLTVQGQETHFKGYPQEDFPPFPSFKELYTFSLSKKDVVSLFPRVLVSVSKSAIKPELASISCVLEKETLLIASTDSFRLSEERFRPVALNIKNQRESFLVPARTFEDVVKLSEQEGDANVDFFVGKGECIVKHGETTLYTRLTEGNFPDYQQIVPKNFKTSAVVSRNEIISQLRRASIFANKLNSVALEIQVKQKLITFESKNNQGAYKGVVKSDWEGEDLFVIFNFQYLLQGVESFADEKLFFGFNSEAHPLLIRPMGRESSLYIVMPMKGAV